MITREEAAAVLDANTPLHGVRDLARTVVALHDEVERLRHDLGKALATIDAMRPSVEMARLLMERDLAEGRMAHLGLTIEVPR